MTTNGWLQILFFSVCVLLVAKPLGLYLGRVFDGSYRSLAWLERPIYRMCGVDAHEDQHWTRYAAGLLLFSVASMLLTYVVLRLQRVLPLNPRHLAAIPDHQAFETSASFATNTNWQSYSGETTMSYFSQMAQLAFHNFASAAVGIAAAVALVRGISRRSPGRLGNFTSYLDVTTLEGAKQTIAMGPVASQRRSSSSARMAAASSTPTRRIRSRIRRRGPTSGRCSPSSRFRPRSPTCSAAW